MVWMPPFFCKDNTSRCFKNKELIFPWRSSPLIYYPLNVDKYRNYSLFCEMGAFWGKGRTPGERWPKCLQWTQLFSKISIGSQALLAEEKIGFQNSKFWKNTLILPHFQYGVAPFWKWGQIRVIFQNFEFWKTIFYSTSNVMDPREFFQNNWVHCRHFGHLSPGVRPFSKIPPLCSK